MSTPSCALRCDRADAPRHPRPPGAPSPGPGWSAGTQVVAPTRLPRVPTSMAPRSVALRASAQPNQREAGDDIPRMTLWPRSAPLYATGRRTNSACHCPSGEYRGRPRTAPLPRASAGPGRCAPPARRGVTRRRGRNRPSSLQPNGTDEGTRDKSWRSNEPVSPYHDRQTSARCRQVATGVIGVRGG